MNQGSKHSGQSDPRYRNFDRLREVFTEACNVADDNAEADTAQE